MKRIHVATENKYDVLVGKGLLSNLGALVQEVFHAGKLCIISDERVNLLYGDAAERALSDAGFTIYRFAFSPGEESKSIATYGRCLEFLAENKFTRTDGILALGGGITGDLAGFVAATYLRGVQFIQVPTTFLAAIDSSVGGKTGVNLSLGKNLAGAFWQPALVICDTDTFKTLAPDIFLDGVAEAIKYGIILDRDLFTRISENAPLTPTTSFLTDVITDCIALKARLVVEDERDTGIRQLLNLGHTIGHAIETCSDYAISHGHAVATGIDIITRAAVNYGYTTEQNSLLIHQVLSDHGFSATTSFPAEALLQVILNDKKRGGEDIHLIIPSEIGASTIRTFPVNALEGFIKAGLR